MFRDICLGILHKLELFTSLSGFVQLYTGYMMFEMGYLHIWPECACWKCDIFESSSLSFKQCWGRFEPIFLAGEYYI